MSKERELLKKCLGTFQTINVWDDCLIKEIIELLEQPEQEPVAWMYDWEHHPDSDGYVNIETNLLTSCESIIETPLASNVRLLYLEPPKREPLSYEKIVDVIQSNILNGLHDLARAIEKAHGIGG